MIYHDPALTGQEDKSINYHMDVFNSFYLVSFFLSIFCFNLVMAFYVYEMRFVKALIESTDLRDYVS